MARIAIDGMGGDHAPDAIIKGIQLFFQKQREDTSVICVCPEEKFKQTIKGAIPPFINFQPCEKYISMDQKLGLSVFRSKDTTMHRIIQMVKDYQADAAFSAGNTALFVSIAIEELGLIEGIDRPAICVHLPNLKNSITLFLDVGAYVSAKPLNLCQYAVLGGLYAKNVLGIENPAVALLNIGGEPGKGDELRRLTYKKLSDFKDINFIGNIEGHELFTGKADVVITDGFSGNIVLKVSEGIGRTFKNILLREIKSSLAGKIGLLIAGSSIKKRTRKIDYTGYGGGILLGVNGVIVIGHGRSSPLADCNAIELAEKIVKNSFIKKLKEQKEKWLRIS